LQRRGIIIYVDHLAWPLVVGALFVIAKRGNIIYVAMWASRYRV
jgi:hypothetical protein